ncbi:MAG: ester cyclase [Deinococcota bacterium]
MSNPANLAHAFVDALNQHDVSLFDSFISAETYINHNAFVDDGIDNAKATFAMFFQAFPDFAVTAEDVMIAGDKVIGRFTYTGTHQGNFMGNIPTGNTIHMRSIDIWRVQDGKFVEHWDELNTLEFFGQLGAVPQVAA